MSEIEAGTFWVRSERCVQIVTKPTEKFNSESAWCDTNGRDGDFQNRLGTGDWALEPGGADREFGHREWGVRAAGDGGGTAREAQRVGRAGCWGGHWCHHDVLCG